MINNKSEKKNKKNETRSRETEGVREICGNL